VAEELKSDAELSGRKRKLGTAWVTTVFSAVALLLNAIATIFDFDPATLHDWPTYSAALIAAARKWQLNPAAR